MTEPDLYDFIEQHKLPAGYIDLARHWFIPVADEIAERQKYLTETIILGINGSQGSGKSTLADLLNYLFAEQYGMDVVVLSIDDFYYTRQHREELSKNIHPLLLTRGVPGTHDVDLALDVINGLIDGNSTMRLPRFDKSTDDRVPEQYWEVVSDQPDIIIFEGWCLGAEPQPDVELEQAINELESSEDKDSSWRRYVNRVLHDDYQELFSTVDIWIMLKAPSFDCVHKWRMEQEDKLRNRLEQQNADTGGTMDSKQIARFIQHYQRITEYLLKTLPPRVDYLFELDTDRNIINSSRPKGGWDTLA
jgi:D-glycerate 3-kinase